MSASESEAGGAAATAAPTAPDTPEPFSFTGRGSEYFGIWIVNVALSVVTLGIYSAWAKVRRLQYFYRNTHVAGSSFDYHGDPVAILKGRLIAVALLIAYSFAGELNAILGAAVLIALAAVMPWLLLRSFRFRLRNSSLRGLRFGFHAGNPEAYNIFLKWPALVVLSVYLLAPMFHQRLKAFQHTASAFGNVRFGFHARVGQFYRIYLILAGVAVASTMVFFALAGGAGALLTVESGPDPRRAGEMLALFGAASLLVLLTVRSVFTALVANLVWTHTSLGPHRFECRLSPSRMLWIQLSNLAAILLTIGLFKPFADVRLARYRLDCMRLLVAGDPEAFFAEQAQGVPATGEEVAEMFDIDIAL